MQKKARKDRRLDTSPFSGGTLEFGTIKEKASAAEILDNSLIDEVNKFDTAAVIKAAKEWKPN